MTTPRPAGLKRQHFLVAQGNNIVPTDAGLKLFGVLQQADPALVDPGMTAQLECLLDDVVIGKQEMIGAIDAVCDVARRIIGKLKNGAPAGATPLLGPAFGGVGGIRPPHARDEAFCSHHLASKARQPAGGVTPRAEGREVYARRRVPTPRGISSAELLRCSGSLSWCRTEYPSASVLILSETSRCYAR